MRGGRNVQPSHQVGTPKGVCDGYSQARFYNRNPSRARKSLAQALEPASRNKKSFSFGRNKLLSGKEKNAHQKACFGPLTGPKLRGSRTSQYRGVANATTYGRSAQTSGYPPPPKPLRIIGNFGGVLYPHGGIAIRVAHFFFQNSPCYYPALYRVSWAWCSRGSVEEVCT